jgi:hypothetical protein
MLTTILNTRPGIALGAVFLLVVTVVGFFARHKIKQWLCDPEDEPCSYCGREKSQLVDFLLCSVCRDEAQLEGCDPFLQSLYVHELSMRYQKAS